MVSTRNIMVQIHSDDLVHRDCTWERVRSFTNARGIENAMLSKEGMLIFVGGKKVDLNNGMLTLQNRLGLIHEPTRVTGVQPIPEKYLENYVRHGYDPHRLQHKFGEMFEAAALRKIVARTIERPINKQRNKEICAKSTYDLVAEGVVPVEKALMVESNKQLMERLEKVENRNPDLDGDFETTFEHWDMASNSDTFEQTGQFPPTNLKIVGLPTDTVTKRKHYYIYSRLPGFGKTFAMNGFQAQINSYAVNDLNNWFDVPTSTQFLIIEEVGAGKMIPFGELKALTGGVAQRFRGNSKTHGSSFVPRKDVQVIMLSNVSMYEVYGEWDNKLGRRVISTERAKQLEQRFHVVRLDGKVDDDKMKAMHPSDWEAGMFIDKLNDEIYKYTTLPGATESLQRRDLYNEILTMYSTLRRVMPIWLARHPNHNPRGLGLYLDNRHSTKAITPILGVQPSTFVEHFFTEKGKERSGSAFTKSIQQLLNVGSLPTEASSLKRTLDDCDSDSSPTKQPRLQ